MGQERPASVVTTQVVWRVHLQDRLGKALRWRTPNAILGDWTFPVGRREPQKD